MATSPAAWTRWFHGIAHLSANGKVATVDRRPTFALVTVRSARVDRNTGCYTMFHFDRFFPELSDAFRFAHRELALKAKPPEG